LFFVGGLEIEFFDAIAANDGHPSLFGMGGVDEHARWHWCFLHGVEGRCLTARSFDALIVSMVAVWLDNNTAGEGVPKRPETG
jgi:hypothetical protein